MRKLESNADAPSPRYESHPLEQQAGPSSPAKRVADQSSREHSDPLPPTSNLPDLPAEAPEQEPIRNQPPTSPSITSANQTTNDPYLRLRRQAMASSGQRDAPVLLLDHDGKLATSASTAQTSSIKPRTETPSASPSKVCNRSEADSNVHRFLQQNHLDSEKNATLLLGLGFKSEVQFVNTFAMGDEQLVEELWNEVKQQMDMMDYITLKGVVKRKVQAKKAAD